MGPHVAILIAWGKLPSRAHEVADRKWWSSAWRAVKIRGVQGGGTPWRRFQGPPEALGRVWGGAPEQRARSAEIISRVQGGAPANRFQERRSLQGTKRQPPPDRRPQADSVHPSRASGRTESVKGEEAWLRP